MLRPLLFIITVGLTACASTPPAPGESAPPETPAAAAPVPVDPTQEIEIKQTLDLNLTPTGRLLAVDFTKGTGLIGSERTAAFVDALKEAMVAKGFVVVADPVKAHVHVAVVTYHPRESTWGLKLVGFINAYGKRPVQWFDERAEMPVSLAERWDTFSGRALAGLSALEVKAPAVDQKMKGPPGCIPRFGFEAEERDGVPTVISVRPKSPAAHAGVRVGDVIEAINAVDFATFSVNDRDVYESRVAVPLRLSRGGKSVRTNIRAEVACAGS